MADSGAVILSLISVFTQFTRQHTAINNISLFWSACLWEEADQNPQGDKGILKKSLTVPTPPCPPPIENHCNEIATRINFLRLKQKIDL